MSRRSNTLVVALALAMSSDAALAALASPVGPDSRNAPLFSPSLRAVSTWREEAARHLVLAPDQILALRGTGGAPTVARCVKLNNYWCIKKAGWDGELASDGEGHVAFASAVEGAAVAALLLKRYYIDFGRKTAMAIVSHWAPAQCDATQVSLSGASRRTIRPARTTAPRGLGRTLRARWLSTHPRGFVTPSAGRANTAKRSAIADRVPRPMPTPTIAFGLGEIRRPMTLDALMMSSPKAPPSRSMIGMPGRGIFRNSAPASRVPGSGCTPDAGRIASYAVKAATGIKAGPDGDLALFDAAGAPTGNLEIVMANMSRVEIGPLGPTPELIEAGIAAAFRPGRNPPKL